jgi:NET1-associated nuclear protein 1 (U3 small nucleolar RNA-associated protein 17)
VLTLSIGLESSSSLSSSSLSSSSKAIISERQTVYQAPNSQSIVAMEPSAADGRLFLLANGGAGAKELIIINRETQDFFTVRHPNRPTALAVTDTLAAAELVVAVGDERGQIHVWRFPSATSTSGDDSELIRPHPAQPIAKLHWHAHSVHSLCFSTDGTHLYSGGEEAVLVQWNLQLSGGGADKQFLPRLGGTLRRLSYKLNSGLLTATQLSYQQQPIVACALDDNSVKLIALVQMQVCLAVQGLKSPSFSSAGEDFITSTNSIGNYIATSGIAAIRKLPQSASGKVLAVQSRPCSLQFWDCAQNKSIYEVRLLFCYSRQLITK